jgi:glycosyltransferase involved in cell wall biosynthesis
MILEAFEKDVPLPIVMVGNWMNSKFGIETKRKWSNNRNLILIEAIYDRKKLDILRSNCAIYIHGHSAGGTNPSLVEAMHLGLPIFAFASGYNEFTTQHSALYFRNAGELKMLVSHYKSYNLEKMGSELHKIASLQYTWKQVSESYKGLFLN